MAESKIAKSATFRGAEGTRKMSLGTGTTITPTVDGWLIILATTNSGASIPPIITLKTASVVLNTGIGITASGQAVSAAAPVKAGVTYTVETYRCTIGSETLFY